jgi:diguanylate cyclase (GGDEF)-like protein
MEKEDIDYSKESILIVDDDPHSRETLKEFLAYLGLSIMGTANGSNALKLLEEKEYTFLLTDMKMPGIGGLELIRRVRDDFLDVSIIAMTGYSAEYKYVDVISSGASDFINKPFDLEELEAKIRRIITERNLREELSRLSITDSLTELFNQRHFYTRMTDEIKRAERQKNALALILMDLDDFKQYNDTYGHLAGDEALRSLGQTINEWIRENVDSGYRYGGDEFAIILIDASLEIAKNIGKRIHNSFKESENLTISLGYARFSEGMSAEKLVAKADKDLYKVKNSLKNSENC